MAAPTTLPALLGSLTQSLSLAQEATPKIAEIEHPKDGISLLDVKNELLLSYLQNLVFLILLKLRNAKSAAGSTDLDDSVRAKLVELRLYLEKGARPLEEKLRFSIERFLRTAEDTQRDQQMNGKKTSKGAHSGSESGSDDEDEDDSDEGDNDAAQDRRPSHSRRPGRAAAPNLHTLVDDVTARPTERDDGPSGIYRPPKRDRAVMETTRARDKSDGRRPQRSHTMEEFVNSELSAAPMVEPSIGTTIVQGGRKMKTAQERKDEDERREYEETNLVRLPKLSKKDRAKKNKEAGRSARMQFGGEEWRDLGEGVDRIDRLTKRKGPAGGSVRALLDKSRKRGFDTSDGPRGSGHGPEIGERFQKKVRVMEGGRRDRGKRR
ncbi:hypothetical protein JDV02_000027 [Purpureocillium takamizusanense]|uniref:Sas10 utp3 c1d family protein n=1 Tax=Purpureocillium takamizusanense TaxID=2060973 RepID=A0A9Q8Q5B0_9HYPO|nr:uncharacterized protein JDV02_000027 [Purpureocillium takamizusanense]UNI13270.1 hypothetical protein JDV02_000027 [Purpureocillium takamizusanense]